VRLDQDQRRDGESLSVSARARFCFKSGKGPHINNVELGRFGRNRSNVWPYSGANAFGKERDAELAMHPTVKPLAMVSDAILDCTKRGDIVLDIFAGSGSTLIAAEKTGRRGFGMEIDPYYADVIIRRFAKTYGISAERLVSETTLGRTSGPNLNLRRTSVSRKVRCWSC